MDSSSDNWFLVYFFSPFFRCLVPWNASKRKYYFD